MQGHDGTISLDEAPGVDATFIVTLPIAVETIPAAAAPRIDAAVGGDSSILIVDDEPELAQGMAEIAAGFARRVDVATNGAEALRYAEAWTTISSSAICACPSWTAPASTARCASVRRVSSALWSS